MYYEPEGTVSQGGMATNMGNGRGVKRSGARRHSGLLGTHFELAHTGARKEALCTKVQMSNLYIGYQPNMLQYNGYLDNTLAKGA
jgi:hypothetical protein